MEEIIYINGDLISPYEAKLSPFDHGFLYGYGLFETMRAYNGTIFRLDRHLARLYRSAKTLGIAFKPGSLDLQKACYDTLEANKLTEARLRLTLSAGEGDMTPNLDTCSGITVFIAARRLVTLPPESYQSGFSAILSSLRRNSQSPLSQLKSTCYLENVLAKQEARAAGVDEALILNERGLVAEGSTSNIFLIKGKLLVTPSLKSGVLPGITRETVLELARYLGLEAVEREVQLDKLAEVKEAFLTYSILEIMPLTRFGNEPIGPGRPGVLTKQLMSTYKELVDKETHLR